MSTQSIIHNTRENLSMQADELYMKMGYQFLIKNKYGVGKGYDKETFKSVRWIERLMCEDNCLLCDVEERVKESLNLLMLNCK